MLHYNKDTGAMSIVAKDTGDFVFIVDNYILDNGDAVYFTVNTELEKENPVLQKKITEFTNGKAIIHLTSKETNLKVGNYLYDIEVDTADGRVDTVVGPAKFKVVGGVRY